ncbi:hypothetical protein P8452_54878 [Trifolium repens]|nr:hypothetical protein P8452_54878 [Trifolium repens]
MVTPLTRVSTFFRPNSHNALPFSPKPRNSPLPNSFTFTSPTPSLSMAASSQSTAPVASSGDVNIKKDDVFQLIQAHQLQDLYNCLILLQDGLVEEQRCSTCVPPKHKISETTNSEAAVEDVDGGAGGVEVSSSGGELGLVPSLDPVNTIGPVQDTGSKLGGVVGKKGGRVKKSGDVIGPKFLRTRRGDVCVEGPSVSKGVEERCVVVTHVSDDETHVAHKEVMVERQRVMSSRSCVNKKALCKRPLPELPPKKMRYFSAPPQPRNRPSRRKKTEQRVNPGAATVESDSIHNSDLTPENHEIVATNEELLLEVVLPCLPADVATSNSFSPLANQEESGVMCLINNADAVSGRANDIALEPPSRQIMEAKKISDIQQQVGICVQGSQEDWGFGG